MILQGDIYWVDFKGGVGSEIQGARPVVVLQSSRINQGGIKTVVVAILSTNLKLASVPGNILIEPQESGLLKESVVNVTQLYTLDKSRLERKAGQISSVRIHQLFQGIDHLFGR